jgi:outer membrane protein assembly factor BamE (lipoprotein component of BamABCDE complex)
MKTNLIYALLVWILISIMITSCQTSPQEAYNDIAIGAKKGEVLHAIGSPIRTYRKNGTERWVYKMQSKSGTWMYKELVIRNGIVINKEIPEQSAKPKDSDYEELK